jgi:hypothetical protein
MSFEDIWLFDRPELLAGFVDGELDDAERAEVEALLASDLKACELYHDQKEFSPANWRFWRDVQPPEPTEHIWRMTQDRIEADLRVPVAELGEPDVLPMRRGRRRGRWLFAGGGVVAAALMIGLPGDRPVVTNAPPPPVSVAEVPPAPREPDFVFATDQDVEIVSMAHADAGMLLVGAPPLADPMQWAVGADVVMEYPPPDPQGHVPDMTMPDGPTGPMIMNLTTPNTPNPVRAGE